MPSPTRSAGGDAAFVGVAVVGLPVVLFLTLGSVLTGGPRAAGAALAGLAVSTLAVWWRARRRPPSDDLVAATGWRAHVAMARRWAGRLLGIGFAMLAAAAGASFLGSRPPSQADVVARFRAHEREFEALRDMVLDDALHGILEGGARYAREPFRFEEPEQAGVDAARAQDYRRLLSATGCSRVDASPPASVSFAVAAWGGANRGWRMSLSWLAEPPARLVETIDPGPTSGVAVYSRIEERWYVGFVW